ncbi:MAG: hypothetical protein ACP5TL_03270 [Candidatus Micrarchaeia archaeon]
MSDIEQNGISKSAGTSSSNATGKPPKTWSLILLSIVIIVAVFIAISLVPHHQTSTTTVPVSTVIVSTTVTPIAPSFNEFALEFTNKTNELYGLPANDYTSFLPPPLPYSEPDVSITRAYGLVYGINGYSYINVSKLELSFYYFEPGKLAVLNTSLPIFVDAKILDFSNISMLQYIYNISCKNLTTYWFFNITPANKTDYQIYHQSILINSTYFNSTSQACETKLINGYHNGTANKLISILYTGKYGNYLLTLNAFGNANSFNSSYSNRIFDHLYKLLIQNYKYIE